MNCVKIATADDEPKLEQLWREIESEQQPGDAEAGDRAVRGARQSRLAHDYLQAESSWVLLAEHDGRCVGYASTIRIAKMDARMGFLYIDELHVLAGARRQGHATRLLELAGAQARTLRLQGVRLLVEPENAGARRFYARLGMVERLLIQCETRRLADLGGSKRDVST